MANYTRPNDENHEDSPKDWLNSALTFARALGLILGELEGVVVDVTGDIDLDGNPSKVIVFKKNDMVCITAADEQVENVPEGTRLFLIRDANPN